MIYSAGGILRRPPTIYSAYPVKILTWLLVLAITSASVVAGGPVAQAQTRSVEVLRGVVTLDQPVSGGTIQIFDGSELIQSAPNLSFGMAPSPSA